jgi:hypothetical protein
MVDHSKKIIGDDESPVDRNLSQNSKLKQDVEDSESNDLTILTDFNGYVVGFIHSPLIPCNTITLIIFIVVV